MRNPDLMHTKEIAEYMGLSEWSIRKMVREGKLKAKRTGNGFTTLRSIVEKFREEYYMEGLDG